MAAARSGGRWRDRLVDKENPRGLTDLAPPKNVLHSSRSNSGIGDFEMSKRKDGQARGKYTLEFKAQELT